MRVEHKGLRFSAQVMLACAFITMPLSAAAADDAFCTGLKKVVADAPNGFMGLRGDLTKTEQSAVPPPVMMSYYATSLTLDGAADCDIQSQQAGADGRTIPNYECRFAIKGNNKGAETRQLANRAAACIAGTSRPMGPGLDKDGGLLDMHSKDFDIDYSVISGPANKLINFAVQANRK